MKTLIPFFLKLKAKQIKRKIIITSQVSVNQVFHSLNCSQSKPFPVYHMLKRLDHRVTYELVCVETWAKYVKCKCVFQICRSQGNERLHTKQNPCWLSADTAASTAGRLQGKSSRSKKTLYILSPKHLSPCHFRWMAGDYTMMVLSRGGFEPPNSG